MNFEWDLSKSEANLEKHGIDFQGAKRFEMASLSPFKVINLIIVKCGI
jgi:uncharacterized DUF497 family protein